MPAPLCARVLKVLAFDVPGCGGYETGGEAEMAKEMKLRCIKRAGLY